MTDYNQAISRNSLLTKERLKNNIYYVKKLSFLLDIMSIFWTIRTVLFSENVNKKSTSVDRVGAAIQLTL